MVSSARRDALNSTGSVTSWKSVVKENSSTPRPNQAWLYRKIPIRIRI